MNDGCGRKRNRLLVLTGLTAILIAATGVASAYVIGHHTQNLLAWRPAGIPASVPLDRINLMALSPVPARAAPGFTLTDQNGRVLPLSAFRGKVIVLEFMDPHCTDICPIVSAEFTDAYHDLRKLAAKVVFAAVNVNQYHTAVADVAAFSRDHQLTSIPDWHFFTGPVASLRTVWRDYNVAVQAPGPDADIIHSSVVYFIDPAGRERYLASPEADHTKSGASYLPAGQVAAWGQGIAQIAGLLAG
jgi:cytochrome oxidase Cu insertion factor (SCO1/SenC/PrrC family)